MERLSPKIEIINHFDNLINRVDIDIDSSLEKYNDKQLLSEIHKSTEDNRKNFKSLLFDVKIFHPFDSSNQSLNSWPESTKVVDYLKQIRMKTIKELKNTQEETLEYYKLNSERFKSELNKDIEELRTELFSEKFYFQVNLKQSENRLWPFNVFTFVTDFYMSQSYIDSLEKLINEEKEPFDKDSVFDEKIVLTGLLFKYYIENLLNFPNHVIYVRKQDVLNIESIMFGYKYSAVNLTSSLTIDLSKLVDLILIDREYAYLKDPIKYNLEGLFSLKKFELAAVAVKVDLSIKNLPSLTELSLTFAGLINDDFISSILDQVPYIQELHLGGYFSYFNLDNFGNIRKLFICGTIYENFNLELFKNLCNQLENITIRIFNIEEENFLKLFDGYTFPYLVDFTIQLLYMKRLKKEFIDRLPKPRNQLNLNVSEIELIESDSFSNMQQLTSLDLSCNRIDLIEENAFSKLKNLQILDLSNNKLTNFDRNFIGLGNSVEVKIENNNFNS